MTKDERRQQAPSYLLTPAEKSFPFRMNLCYKIHFVWYAITQLYVLYFFYSLTFWRKKNEIKNKS